MHTKVHDRHSTQLLTYLTVGTKRSLGTAPFGPGLPHCASENSVGCWIGTETTLGDPHAVGIRFSPSGVARIFLGSALLSRSHIPDGFPLRQPLRNERRTFPIIATVQNAYVVWMGAPIDTSGPRVHIRIC